MKTALITGASTGIGVVFARQLAQRQMELILVARSRDKLEQLAAELGEQYGVKVTVIVQDLTVAGAGKLVYDTVNQKGINVDLLVNNAGFGGYGAFSEQDLARQLEMIQLNNLVLVELSHYFLRPMLAGAGGAIINVASIAGFQPLPYLSVYAATKAFVLSFSESLWAENKDKGVEILALCPGPTESNFFEVARFPRAFMGKNGRLDSAEVVVQEALTALANKRPNVVAGKFANKIIVNLPRFLPRSWIVSLIEKQFKV
ncbi:MAG: SDR family oxidoreductase [Microcystis aeruginosa K13-07]|jgi:short-subunit dehydrogenase|nr:SDR family oxidoreductase [Microcystis aeruginosa K13-07]